MFDFDKENSIKIFAIKFLVKNPIRNFECFWRAFKVDSFDIEFVSCKIEQSKWACLGHSWELDLLWIVFETRWAVFTSRRSLLTKQQSFLSIYFL